MTTRIVLIVFGFCFVNFSGCESEPDVSVDLNGGSDGGAGNGNGGNADAGMPSGVECVRNSQCNDGEAETDDICVDGACIHPALDPCPTGHHRAVVGTACVRDRIDCGAADLDDRNPCTNDVCDPDTGEITHPSKCDDGNVNTIDSCVAATGHCVNRCLQQENSCTEMVLSEAGVCEARAKVCAMGFLCDRGQCVPAPCEQNMQCADDDPCTIDSCQDGTCHNAPRLCDDGDETTLDRCIVAPEDFGVPFLCESHPTACTGGCDDNNPCTADRCELEQCIHEAAACGEGTFCSPMTGNCIPVARACERAEDCADGNACTVELCEAGECVFSVELSVSCDDGFVCDASSGDCLELEACPGGCDDGDQTTRDRCEAGRCVFEQPVACGDGTELNPDTGECDALPPEPECVDGQSECPQRAGQLVYRVCIRGDWGPGRVCGAVNDPNVACFPGTGCAEPGPPGGL